MHRGDTRAKDTEGQWGTSRGTGVYCTYCTDKTEMGGVQCDTKGHRAQVESKMGGGDSRKSTDKGEEERAQPHR